MRAASPQAAGRLASIDALRGLNVAVMILVNDLAHVRGAPAWAQHQPEHREGLTFVDLILPLFLFLLGASVPLAIERRRAQGERLARVLAHVARRAASLILMGVFMVNMPLAAEAPMGMRPALWSLLVLLALLALFHDAPPGWPARALRIVAAAALLALALRFRGLDSGQIVPLRPQWYGILGVLGWAYLLTSLVYLATRGDRAAVLGALALLVVLHLGERAGGAPRLGALGAAVVSPALGPCGPIALAGLLAGVLLLPGSPAPAPRLQARVLLPLGVGLALAGLGLRPLHPVHKATATPSYILVSAGLCCLLYLAGHAALSWPALARRLAPLQRLGQDALLAFLLPPLLYAALDLYEPGLRDHRFASGLGGALFALLFTALVLALLALLRRAHLRLRL